LGHGVLSKIIPELKKFTMVTTCRLYEGLTDGGTKCIVPGGNFTFFLSSFDEKTMPINYNCNNCTREIRFRNTQFEWFRKEVIQEQVAILGIF
jgi:hypothetical protein